MSKKFNVTGTCIPEKHYMVDISDKLVQIKKLIDDEEYFTINRGRQYGKTTTLSQLRRFLADEYVIILISFQGMGEVSFTNEEAFCKFFLTAIDDFLERSNEDADWMNETVVTFFELGRHLTKKCKNKKIVLMIDEVDQASNYRIFLEFLALLRDKFLKRQDGLDDTFHSVILVGVYDIKNIKLKMINDGVYIPTEDERQVNSPWNIAAQFEVEMSFSIPEIQTMLVDYEKDYQTGMDMMAVATEIDHYTSGYPVLVTSICKYMTEKLNNDWTTAGVRQAVKLVLTENSPLFEHLVTNLTNNKEFSNLVYHILMIGTKIPFNIYNPLINLGIRYGYFSSRRKSGGGVMISNKIFEIFLTNYFVNQDIDMKIQASSNSKIDTEGVIENDKLNMQVCLEKFSKYYHQYYNQNDVAFFEHEARKLFLMFVSAIVNGSGFAYMESELGDKRRTDVIVSFMRHQFIVELKIWRGDKKHKEAQQQLLGYMDKLGVKEGYLLTFDFNEQKERYQKWVDAQQGRKIFDVRV